MDIIIFIFVNSLADYHWEIKLYHGTYLRCDIAKDYSSAKLLPFLIPLLQFSTRKVKIFVA